MTQTFLAEMQKSTALVRDGNVLEATKLIQSVLRAGVAEAEHSSSDLEEQPIHQRRGVKDLNRNFAQPGHATARPRRSLRENIALLQKGTALPLPRVARGREPIPHGASFETNSFSCAAGSRNYKLYVPSKPSISPRPLVVMLHGCTQDADDFASGTGMNRLAEELNVLIAYPEQSSGHNQLKCWNWFDPQHQRQNFGEPAIIAGIVDEIVSKRTADRSRIFVIGLSAGGAMAIVLGKTYPEVFSGIGVHSGLPYLSASDVASAFAAMKKTRSGSRSDRGSLKTRTIVFHGDADTTVHVGNGSQVFSEAFASDDTKLTISNGEVPGGHRYSVTKAKSADGETVAEYWMIKGAGHAWSGGHLAGSYTDPKGPDASREMLRFFRIG
jgi:poly(hydroxyalkanoate) depolymerase family esterase